MCVASGSNPAASSTSPVGTPCQQALVTHVEFVLEDEFEELAVAQTGGGGFLQTHLQALKQAKFHLQQMKEINPPVIADSKDRTVQAL